MQSEANFILRQRQFSWMNESNEPPPGIHGRAASRADLVIMASAGTGKTFQLSNRYLKLLFDGEPLERILATTFTRKAAGEIFDRIVERLVLAGTDARQLAELANELGMTTLTRDACLDVLARFSRDLHRTRIDTLDAFFAEVARCFSFEMRLPSDWRIVEEAEDARLKLQALDQLLRSQELDAARQLVHWISGSEADRQVVPVLENAIEQAYQLFVETRDQGAAAWQLLQPQKLRWTEAQLQQALDRVASLAAPGRVKKALLKIISEAGQGDWGEVYSATLVRNAVETGTYYASPIAPELIATLVSLREYAREALINSIARQTVAAYDLLSQFERHYWECKRDTGGIRFDDVPVALTELRDAAGLGRLAYRLDGWIDHLLLDEFQDTSAMQWAVLEPLSRRIVASQDKARTFFCVGDVKQAIYAFRGGTSSILTSLSDRAAHAWLPLESEQLNVSYRSDQAIIDFVNRAFQNLERHGNWNEAQAARAGHWDRTFPQHTTMRTEFPGFACLRTAPAGEHRKQGEVTLEFAARLASELYTAAPDRELTILVRTNDAAAMIMEELLLRGLNPGTEGGKPLTDSAAVRLALSALQLAEHPQDMAAAFHVAHSPLGSLLELQPDQLDTRFYLGELAERMRRQLLTVGYGDTLAAWGIALRSSCTRREWYRWQQFLDMAYAHEPHATTRPVDFIRHVEHTRMADPTASKLQVMTIHQAKGLGFDRVIVTELHQRSPHIPHFVYGRDPVHHRASQVVRYVSDGVRPAMPQSVLDVVDEDNQRRAEDALCHLYVALTRAQHELQVVIGPGEQGLLKLPKDSEGLLRAALTESGVARPDRILFQVGQPHSIGEQPAGSERRERMARPTIKLQPAPEAALETPSTKSHGQLAVGSAFHAERTRGMQFGTLIHAWFESILWLDETGIPDHEQLLTIAASTAAPMVDVEDASRAFQRFVSGPTVRSLLTKSSYLQLTGAGNDRWPSLSPRLALEVHNEFPIAARHAEAATWGIVDRLVLWCEDGQPVAAHILDYKTDTVDGDASMLRKTYGDQLTAYAKAITTAFALAPQQVQTNLILLTTDQLI